MTLVNRCTNCRKEKFMVRAAYLATLLVLGASMPGAVHATKVSSSASEPKPIREGTFDKVRGQGATVMFAVIPYAEEFVARMSFPGETQHPKDLSGAKTLGLLVGLDRHLRKSQVTGFVEVNGRLFLSRVHEKPIKFLPGSRRGKERLAKNRAEGFLAKHSPKLH